MFKSLSVYYSGWQIVDPGSNQSHRLFVYGFYIFKYFKRFKGRIIFSDTLLYWHTATRIHSCNVCGCLLATTVDMSIFNRPYGPQSWKYLLFSSGKFADCRFRMLLKLPLVLECCRRGNKEMIDAIHAFRFLANILRTQGIQTFIH